MPNSYDSGSRPLTHVKYQSTNNPYDPSGAYGGADSTGYLPQRSNKRRGPSKWIKFGIPLLIIIVAAAVVGGILGARSHKSSSSSSSSSSPASASSAVANKNNIGVFATSTDSYGLPVYPTASNAAYIAPTFVSGASAAWPTETFKPASPTPTTVRPDRPRIIAPKYKWDALPNLIANDPYMSKWNESIVNNATAYKALGLVAYTIDGSLTASGILDVARSVKERVKAYAYAYRVTGDQQWVSQCWDELQNAAGNTSQPFAADTNDQWNSKHFLDLAEMTAAFAIGYDWLYDVWTSDQKNKIMWSIITQGLSYGISVYTNTGVQNNIGWWSLPNNGKGNWNCVCNSGLTLGALAILNDDPTGSAAQILGFTIPNAVANCATAPTTDGSWTETANYWYFGTTAHAEMTSSLMSATGSDYGLLTADKNFNNTGLFHMYVTGMTSLFNFGDHGPNKYSTTANAMMFYGTQYNIPKYTLFQRDQRDGWSDPWAMFWYDPTVTGAFWDNLPLDHFFTDELDQWASMRSSWTTNNGLYLAAKAGQNSGPLHQNHNDLDVGDFVLDAMGQRWAGELGSGDYDATDYFQGETQNSTRWLYYRKRTEGQNTVVVGGENQLVTSAPKIKFDSTNEAQDATTSYQVPSSSTAFFTMDMTSAYDQVTSMKRGIRLLNGRRQVLIQDEMNSSAGQQWRMHTNATINLDSDSQATLSLGGKTMIVKILSPSSGAKFENLPATRLSTDPTPPAADQPNPGVSVLAVDLAGGQNNLQILFNPQWDGFSSFVTPPSVDIDSWTLTSHNSS